MHALEAWNDNLDQSLAFFPSSPPSLYELQYVIIRRIRFGN